MMHQSYKALKRYAMPFVLLCLFIFLVQGLSAQDMKTAIKGLVEDEKGQAMEGVSVELKNEPSGTVQSAITDKSVMFVFEHPGTKGPYVFRISHLGYVTQIIRKEHLDAKKEEALYIVLKTASTSLDEVVISYGRQRRQDVT